MGDIIWGKLYTPKMGGNRQFQTKTTKYNNRNIAETTNLV